MGFSGVALGVMAAATVGTGIYSVVKGGQDREDARKNSEEMARRADEQLALGEKQYASADKERTRLMEEAKRNNDNVEASSAKEAADTNRAMMQQSRQRKKAQAGTSYRDTILTGPQGLQPSADKSTQKTLLGM